MHPKKELLNALKILLPSCFPNIPPTISLFPRKERWENKLMFCYRASKRRRALLKPPWRPCIHIHTAPVLRSWRILTFNSFSFPRTVFLRSANCSKALPDLQRRWELVQRPLDRTAVAVTNRFLKKLEIIEIKRKD
jgi:hypothetical protein